MFLPKNQNYNKILDKIDIGLIDYYEMLMKYDVDVIVENEDIFIYVPKTFEATNFLDLDTEWCSSKDYDKFDEFKNRAVMFRIHFKQFETSFKFTKYYNALEYGRSKFADHYNDYYNDKELEEKYPSEVNVLKEYIPKIYSYFKEKSSKKLTKDFDLTQTKTYNKVVNLLNSNSLNVNSVNFLSTVIDSNPSSLYNTLVQEIDEIVYIEKMLVLSSYNARLTGYTKEDLMNEEICNR